MSLGNFLKSFLPLMLVFFCQAAALRAEEAAVEISEISSQLVIKEDFSATITETIGVRVPEGKKSKNFSRVLPLKQVVDNRYIAELSYIPISLFRGETSETLRNPSPGIFAFGPDGALLKPGSTTFTFLYKIEKLLHYFQENRVENKAKLQFPGKWSMKIQKAAMIIKIPVSSTLVDYSTAAELVNLRTNETILPSVPLYQISDQIFTLSSDRELLPGETYLIKIALR